MNLLNQIRTTSRNIDNVLRDNTVVPSISFPLNNNYQSSQLKRSILRFKSLHIEIETLDHLLLMPNKLPSYFYNCTYKFHEFQFIKCIGYCKHNWESSLKNRFSRCHQKYELTLKEEKN